MDGKVIYRLPIFVVLILLLTNVTVIQQTIAGSDLHAIGGVFYKVKEIAGSGDDNDDNNNDFYKSFLTGIPGAEKKDQEQIQYDNYRFAMRHGLWGAQSFKPSLEILTKVELLICKGGFPSNDLIISIRDELTGSDLTSATISSDELSYGVEWKEFDFPDIDVNTEKSYYIVMHTVDGCVQNCYLWGFGRNTSYADGSLLYSGSYGSSWNNFDMYDFCFITYGFDYNQSNPPNNPTNPSPDNNSKNISLNPILSVHVSDPDDSDVLDVYFFNASGNTLIDVDYGVSNGGIASVNWHGLQYNSSYSWYVIVSDSTSETISDTWHFTTFSNEVNHPPLKPENPLPENKSVGINISPKLSVDVIDLDDDTMNVSFYNASNDDLIDIVNDVISRSNVIVDWPDLSYNTTYSWYVIANDSKSETKSDTWSFTTEDIADNHPPDIPGNPDPANDSKDIGLFADLWWSSDDLDGDLVTYNIYFEANESTPDILVSNDQYSTHYDPGALENNTLYYWQIVAMDSHGDSTAGPIWHFTTMGRENYPPNKPTNPSPRDGETGVSKNPILSVHVSDPDGDSLSVKFFNAADDSLIGNHSHIQNNSNVEITWSGLSSGTTYNWYAAVNDTILENKSDIWSFKTKPKPKPDQDTDSDEPTNQNPTADANGPYIGFIDEEITFDGSNSSDSDGIITNYTWDFGDSTIGYGIYSTHVYDDPGEYIVILKVTDDYRTTDTDETIGRISQPNIPPIAPEIDGTSSGTQNTEYTYTTVSTDADNDTIQYTFNWDDGKTDKTDFIASGIEASQTHSWTSAGIYTITVKAFDNKTESGTTKYTVLIDVLLIDNKIKGYLIDEDSDGIYDLFHNDSSGEETDVELQENGTYLIDDDGDGKWDYIYDPETDILTEYVETTGETDDNDLFLCALGLLAIVVIIVLIIIFWKQKKDKKSEAKLKETTEEKKEEKLDKTKKKSKKSEKIVNKKQSSGKSAKDKKKPVKKVKK